MWHKAQLRQGQTPSTVTSLGLLFITFQQSAALVLSFSKYNRVSHAATWQSV